MKSVLVIAVSTVVFSSACDRLAGAKEVRSPAAPAKLNLLIERERPADPLERARRAIDELRTTISLLPSDSRARILPALSRVELDAQRALARLDESRAADEREARRLRLELRAVPLSLSLLMTDVAFDIHRAQLPEEAGHELTHATEEAHRAWIDLVLRLEANEA